MFDFEAIVVEIERKVRKLAGENQRLRLEVEKANDRCKQLQEQLDNQNIVINNLKLGNTLTQKGDSVEIRLKINQLIRSIDKSLALINKSPEE